MVASAQLLFRPACWILEERFTRSSGLVKKPNSLVPGARNYWKAFSARMVEAGVGPAFFTFSTNFFFFFSFFGGGGREFGSWDVNLIWYMTALVIFLFYLQR